MLKTIPRPDFVARRVSAQDRSSEAPGAPSRLHLEGDRAVALATAEQLLAARLLVVVTDDDHDRHRAARTGREAAAVEDALEERVGTHRWRPCAASGCSIPVRCDQCSPVRIRRTWASLIPKRNAKDVIVTPARPSVTIASTASSVSFDVGCCSP